MRILFVTNNYTPYSGGVVSSITATVNELRKKGHDVIVIAPNFLGNAHDDPAWVKRIPSLFRFRFKKNYMAIMWRPKNFLYKLFEQLKPDVVHVHHPFLLGARAVAIARKMGIKTVFTYHTLYEAYAHYIPLPSFLTRPIINRRVNALCKQVDQIIVPSSAIQSYVRSQGIEHTTIIPSGLKEQYRTISFMQKNSEPPYQLLYVGRFVKEKNITALFDAMALLPQEYELTLVGYGEYLKSLQKYAYEKKRLSQERIRFIIKPDQDELLSIYRSAHLFLFPSVADTQGIVIAEAMACSVPVIALDGPGQRDIIRTDENGYIVADTLRMAELIQRTLADEKKYSELQKDAWESAHAYDPEILVTRCLQLYQLQ